ncbi:MAG: hypothetical protein HGA53_03635, partial [Anaerolineaceae bacterium]|nr:hypothetical protein [Anaerolineaceae bacterium]
YGNVESSQVVETRVCQVVTETRVTKTVVVTSTPDPSETPVTRIPTLGQPPSSGSGGAVLIPVTGDDLSTTSVPAVSFASLFTNFGMMLLGLGLVFHAASKKFTI